jgi:fatty-acyl-CoA synthase
LIVPKPEKTLEKQEIIEFLSQRVAKWWVPDEVIFVQSLPVGGTGKVQKNDLRLQYGNILSDQSA